MLNRSGLSCLNFGDRGPGVASTARHAFVIQSPDINSINHRGTVAHPPNRLSNFARINNRLVWGRLHAGLKTYPHVIESVFFSVCSQKFLVILKHHKIVFELSLSDEDLLLQSSLQFMQSCVVCCEGFISYQLLSSERHRIGTKAFSTFALFLFFFFFGNNHEITFRI